MLKRNTILAVTIIFLLLAVGCSVSKEDTKENAPEETQEAETMETKEGDNDLSKEVTLTVWLDSKMENTSYSDASSKTVETFIELFETLFNQKEDTEDIIVMGEDSFESIFDGVIKHDGKSIGFLNDGSTIPWKNTDYENAWYLEVIISEPYEARGIILPKDSKYITVLNELLDTLNYEKIKE